MPRATYHHWIHLPTRQETIAKYGEDKLCNEQLTIDNSILLTTFTCQILKFHDHKWHIEKGVRDGVGWTMAWRARSVRMGEAVSKATEAATPNSPVEPSLSPQPEKEDFRIPPGY